ncbi:MAG: TraR/DksA family transcriptional regulator [Phycisphaerae bacterium]
MSSEESLSSDQIEHFRRKLLERRNEITSDLEGLAEESAQGIKAPPPGAASSDLPTHTAEAATDERSKKKPLRLGEHERDMVQAIDEALERIREGNYGLCLMDQEPISPRRLEAKPWARYCLKHAEAQHG